MTGTVLVFIVGAIVINLIIYGGILAIYFAKEPQVDLPQQESVPPVATLPTTRTGSAAAPLGERSVA